MDEARQHALHWAFFLDIMDMSFDDIYDMYQEWCESLPEDQLTLYMAIADGLGNDTDSPDNDTNTVCDTMELSETLYTEEDIWNDVDSDSDFLLN